MLWYFLPVVVGLSSPAGTAGVTGVTGATGASAGHIAISARECVSRSVK